MRKNYLLLAILLCGLLTGCAFTTSSSSFDNSSISSEEATSSSSQSNFDTGYYKSIDFNQSGAQLKTELHKLISKHSTLSYDDLWDAFYDTDVTADGKVWDMYSNYKYNFGTDQNSGNTGSEGTNYNREHSIPKSWFGGSSPMYTDLFHLYPTDSAVNSMRGNYPFGEVASPTKTSGNGSKLGPSSFSGYTGTVFEPIDEYKGDFARTYFYFATCYQDKNITQSSEAVVVFKNESYPTLTTYAINLFLKWSNDDPVSQKEIDRNEAVYEWQDNRNPFIDYPGLENRIWTK